MFAVLAFSGLDFGPRFIGEIAMLTVGAVFLGFVVSKTWPPNTNPKLFAALVPFLALAMLSYVGSATAATALVLFVGLAVVGLALGLS
jgi:hypothetical protein